MPFNQETLARSFLQTRDIFNEYVYKTEDTIADIFAPGYFDASRFADEDGWINGVILAQCSDGNVQGQIDADGNLAPFPIVGGITVPGTNRIWFSSFVGTPIGDEDLEFDPSTLTLETQNAFFAGDVRVLGNAVVEGTLTAIDTEVVIVKDPHIYLNNGYVGLTPVTSGIVSNILMTDPITAAISGAFTAGVPATSNPTIVTTDSDVFSQDDIIQISGSVDSENDGIFEVEDHTGTLLTIRGTGLVPTVEDFTQIQLVTRTETASIARVQLSIERAATDGTRETGTGNTTPIAFTALLTTNIYTADDSLTGNRDVDLATFNLSFTGGNVGVGAPIPAEKLHVQSVGASTFVGTGGTSDGILVTDNSPRFIFENNTLGADKKVMAMKYVSENWVWFSLNDAGTAVDVDDIFVINRDGNVGIGTASPQAGLHGVVTNGLLLWNNSETNGVLKSGRWGISHFTSSTEEPFFGIVHEATSTDNILRLGGGTFLGNAATSIKFLTAANNTTTTGTVQMTLDNVGRLGIGIDPFAKVDIFTNTDGAEILRLNTDRSWTFQQEGTGSATALRLRNTLGINKDFFIDTDGSTQWRSVDGTTTLMKIDQVSGDLSLGTTSANQKLHVLTSGASTATSLLNRGLLLTDGVAPSITFEDSGEDTDKKVMRMEAFDQKIAFSSLNDVGNAVDVADILEIGRDGVIKVQSSILMRAANTAAIMSDTQTLGFRKYYNYIGSASTVDWTINTADIIKADVSHVWETVWKDKAGVASVANPINIIVESGFIDSAGTTQISITTAGGSISLFCDGTNHYTV